MALAKHNTIFVSAQPDQLYFHWQVELYLYQFAKHGIADRCYAIFGYRDKPSEYALNLSRKYKHILLYKDTRPISVPNYYIPSIRPHLLKQFFKEFPELGASVFYHDSDIFLVHMPRFDLLLADNNGYVSDTISYIGYNYINGCQKRYKEKYPAIPENDLLTRMCNCMDVPMDLVKKNEAGSGGAQYLLKHVDAAFWEEVEVKCQSLYSCMKEYEKQHPISNGIQIWTADMWAVLWLYWKRGKSTIVHPELDFSWATSSVTEYYKKNIFHLAGVTGETRKGKFYKGEYIHTNIFKAYAKNKDMFNAIDPSNATYEYVKVLKEYVDSMEPQSFKETTRFLFDSKDAWSSVYTRDDTKQVCGKPVWRSDNKQYILFHNGTSWIITHKQYESEVKAGSGGYTASSGTEPYEDSWNCTCTIKRLD